MKYGSSKNFVSPNEIVLHIAEYNDLFSDFDPRHYSQRALSDDFLYEAKKASREKKDPIKLKFLVHRNFKRSKPLEEVIKKRLIEHFSKHNRRMRKEVTKTVHIGLILTIAGIVLMSLASIVLFKMPSTKMLTNFLIILLEPASWFFFWEGLNLIIFKPSKGRTNLKFYKKMSKCSIVFISE